MTMELEMMKQHLSALNKVLENLNSNREKFIEALGIKRELDKIPLENEQNNIELVRLRDQLKEQKIEKARMLEKTYQSMAKKLLDVLPDGMPFIELDEESGVIEIGWNDTPYDALSGGEKAMFDSALCQAFDDDVIIVEGGELDRENLQIVIDKLTGLDKQVIVNTWHSPEQIPDDWQVVLMGDIRGNFTEE